MGTGVLGFTLMAPRRCLFGWGRLADLGAEAAALGRHALLATGRTAARKSGMLDRALKALSGEGVEVTLFERVERDPSLDTVTEGTELVRQSGCDVVIGLGGGSAMDAAKAMAITAPQPEPIEHYFAGEPFHKNGVPFIAVPTTSGTGAEATNNSVLTDQACGIKKSLRGPEMVPDAALVDPELTVSAPPDLTAHSGMDALCQAMECYVTTSAQPYSDALSLRAMSAIYRALPSAVADGGNRTAREQMALGSHLTGLAFANAGLGAVHGLAHPIGHDYHVPHGLVCAVLLRPVLEFNLPACREKFDRMAEALGVSSGDAVPDAIGELLDRVGVAAHFREFGVPESAIPKILSLCRSGSMASNPRPASDDDLTRIIRQVI